VTDATSAIERTDESHVRTLTLSRPARLNALTASSYRLLASMLRDAAADDEIAVVLLAGAGRPFSSGVDLGELATAVDGGAELSAAFDVLLDA
jgi:enoyl-CoA hydratase/carnithine racemase